MLTTVMNVVEREERKFDIGVRTEEGRGRSRIVDCGRNEVELIALSE